MYGSILRLDCKRQNRVDVNGFLKLFKPSSQEKILAMDTRAPRLNSSKNPITYQPNQVKTVQYPEHFNATQLRTLYYNLAIHGSIPKMTRVFINKDDSIVFEFEDTVKKEDAENILGVLQHLGYTEFTNPEVSGKKIGFDLEYDVYEPARGDVSGQTEV